MRYWLPSLLLMLLTGEMGQADETFILNRTIEENEFHLPRESFRMVERGKEVRHTRLERPCCEFKLDLTRCIESQTMRRRLNENFLTTCVMPFRTYIPNESNMFRIPYGNVRITFDGGRGEFNKTTMGQYPGYDPNLEFTFEFNLQGLSSGCHQCRIQVNDGNNCDLPGIRLWNRSVPGAYNPWRVEYGAFYDSNIHGQARGYFSMFNGFNYDAFKGRTVVVFDQDTTIRIGCGVIRRSVYGECGREPPDESIMPSAGPLTAEPTPEPTPAPQPTIAPVVFTPFPTLPPTPVPTTPAPVVLTAPPTPFPTNRPIPLPTVRPTFPMDKTNAPSPFPFLPPYYEGKGKGSPFPPPIAPPPYDYGRKGKGTPFPPPNDEGKGKGGSPKSKKRARRF
jgi:hypothetical protein